MGLELNIGSWDWTPANNTTLSKENGWSVTWDDVPATSFVGETIRGNQVKVYTDVAGYGEPVISHVGDDWVITYTHVPERIFVSVKKVWDDNGDNEELRPDSINVTLTGAEDGDKTVVLNADNDWSYNWGEMYVYANGQKLPYSVHEDSVEYYTVKVTDDGKGSFTITNTYRPETTKITVDAI